MHSENNCPASVFWYYSSHLILSVLVSTFCNRSELCFCSLSTRFSDLIWFVSKLKSVFGVRDFSSKKQIWNISSRNVCSTLKVLMVSPFFQGTANPNHIKSRPCQKFYTSTASNLCNENWQNRLCNPNHLSIPSLVIVNHCLQNFLNSFFQRGFLCSFGLS